MACIKSMLSSRSLGRAALQEAPTTTLMDLPVALTAQILGHVPLVERLTQCALVCRSWASAAALATEHVQQHKLTTGATAAFRSWVQLHAGQLLSLQLTGHGPPFDALHPLQLPLHEFSQLQQLELERFRLCLPCDGSSRATRQTPRAAQQAGAPLPRLQLLKLRDVELASTRSLSQLTRAPQLTSLEVSQLKITGCSYCSSCYQHKNKTAGVRQVAQALESILQQLPRLSVLKVPGIPITNAAVQEMGRMQGLQQVAFADLKHMPLFDLQLLPSSITQLSLTGNTNSAIERVTTLPQQLPQQLSGLLRLDLECCEVPATMFDSVTQLQALFLSGCTVLQQILGHEYDDEGIPALLDTLPKLTCLQELELDRFAMYKGTIAPRRFSALTASSHLTRLVLTAEESQPLPEGAVQYMFPASRPRPALGLRELTISPRCSDPSDLDEHCINGADLRAIAGRCPALQRLDIAQAVEPDTDLSALLQLPQSCTSLRVGGGAFGDKAAGLVAQLTQLRDLTWNDADEFTDDGLEQLTALDLDSLSIENCFGLSYEPANCFATGDLKLSRHPQMGSVSEQLRAVCD